MLILLICLILYFICLYLLLCFIVHIVVSMKILVTENYQTIRDKSYFDYI